VFIAKARRPGFWRAVTVAGLMLTGLVASPAAAHAHDQTVAPANGSAGTALLSGDLVASSGEQPGVVRLRFGQGHTTDAAVAAPECLFGVSTPYQLPGAKIAATGGVSCNFYAASITVEVGLFVAGILDPASLNRGTLPNTPDLFIESRLINCGVLLTFRGVVYVRVTAPWGEVREGAGTGGSLVPTVCL
jgi:hypothetical protein